MPSPRHKHRKPPSDAFRSLNGDKTVSVIIYKGREYWYHVTKGWRSGRVKQ